MKELDFLKEILGFSKVYLTNEGSLILVIEKNGKIVTRKIEDFFRFIEPINRLEPPLISELMLRFLYERLLKVKEEMDKELEE